LLEVTMPRLSITQRQRETPAGAELLTLCQAITADGELSDDEVLQLRDWLRDHEATDLPARDHLNAVVEEALRDGRVSPNERREVYKAIETILPPDLRPLAKMRRQERETVERERRKSDQAEEKARTHKEGERNRPLARFNFMVAGVRYEGRNEIISDSVTAGDPAYLRRDPSNSHSKNAIEVVTKQGDQVGFVPEEDARNLAPLLDQGALHSATFSKILGSGRYPVPVVTGQLYGKDATLPNLTKREEVPAAQFPWSVIVILAVMVLILAAVCF
jgi:hypothetical protein